MQCLPFEQMPNFTPTSQVLGWRPDEWVLGVVSRGSHLCFHCALSVSTHPEARRLRRPIFKTGPVQVGIVMSFKKSSHGLAHLLARPGLVSDLDQWSQEGQVYPVGMDTWFPGESRKGKKTETALRER